MMEKKVYIVIPCEVENFRSLMDRIKELVDVVNLWPSWVDETCFELEVYGEIGGVCEVENLLAAYV